MTREFFPQVHTWYLPESALVDSLREMSRDGVDGDEGITLWLGRRAQGKAEITHLIGLRGPGVIKRPDFLSIESWLLNDVTDLAIELGVVLVGQIHTHGRGYGIDLSYTDRKCGVRVPHYLSIVAPDYGLRPDTQIGECGVHVFEPNCGYRRLSQAEVDERLLMVRCLQLPFLTVGEGNYD